MFAKLHIANGHFRRLLTNGWRGARASWDWYCELGHGNESEARGLRLLGNGCRRNSLPSMTRINISTSPAAIAESGTGYAMAPELISMS
jgi:hypothetical protein